MVTSALTMSFLSKGSVWQPPDEVPSSEEPAVSSEAGIAQARESLMAIPTARAPTPAPSDGDEMTEDQECLVRRFTKKKSGDGMAGDQVTGRGAGK
jgi:hypothetical protein